MKKVPADPGRTLVARFEDMARRSPDSPALSFMGESLSYDALNRRANRLAHRLRALGVKRGQLVGLHTHRNADVVVGILGILKAGGAYLPLDPVYPRDRIGFMLEDSRVGVVVTEPALAGTMEGTGAALVLPGDLSDEPETDPAPVNAPDDLAYVIYTSGSTGRPKGVQVTHHNVVRLFDSTDHWYGFGPGDVWTLFHSYSFDFSVWEIWGALLYGGRVVVVPQQVSRSPEEFRTLLLDEGVTVLNQTPSAFRLLIQADMAGPRADYALRYVIFGGEALEFQSLRPWFERYGDARPQLVNMYGITETTVHVTYRPVSLADLSSGQGSVIGEPIPDLTLYILDEAGNPAPVGEVGEMYVGGAGVALGYLDRPDLTAQRFLPDRFSGTPGGRLYRTGDLARRLANGDVEYLGRIDHQVKIRGFRIELGEIEAQIAAFPGVREVIVIAREDSPGDRRLVAYVVAPGADAALAEALRSHLRVNLPDYMVPAHFVRMDALPLTENGKVDRRALPAPDRTAGAADYVAPSTPEEETVARIWGEVLGLERIGVHDNFFELGGHSLLVIDVIQRLRAAGLHVDVSRLFLSPTIAEIAAAATAGGDEVAAPAASIPEGAGTITPDMLPLVELGQDDIARIVAAVPGGAANIQDIYPLAPLQEGMLFHNRMGGAGDPYLVTTVLAAPTREALMGYAAALQKVVDRHDILRTAFLSEGLAEPVQVVLRRAPIRVEDVALDPAAGDIAAQLLARFDPRRYRLDVAEAPVLRLFLAEDRANGRWVMLRIHHHLLEDHTTDEMMSEEIIAILDGRGDGLPAPLPFRDFVVRARRVSQSEEYRSFFKGMLADVEEPTAPFGLTDVIGATAEITESRRRLGAAFADRVRRVATQNRVSAASIFHLAWARVVGKCAGREDVVFGTVLFGRMHAGHNAEKVFGPFINSLPIRVGLAGLSVAEGLRRTHTAMGELLRHEHASLAMAQGCSSLPPGAPLFSALLNFRHLKIRGDSEAANHAMAAAIGRMGLELVKFEERTNYPLELSVDDLGDGFMLEAQAQAPVDPANVCAYMERALEEIVTALEQAPDRPLTEIDILPEAERHRILVEWNDTARSYPGPERLHRLIEAQVARTPDATALEFEGRTLTFAEVNARANQLARVLRARGVGPDTLVGVYAERSFEMVVALVAVLKAGGAYVPLDPSYPADRLANMIEDAKAPVILAQRHIMDGLPAGAGEVIALDPDWAAFAGEDASDLPDTGAPTDLAYVIFTSGSTGRPKGAANEHRGICNRINWMQEEYQLTSEDRVLQKTPFSFDVSVWEFFWPLMTGARLVIARPEGHRDSAYLVELIRATGVTVLHFVPSMLRIFLDDEGLAAGTPIRKVMCSGEALPRELQDRFFARLPGVELHNLYGPTEAAVDVTYWPCRPGDSRAMVPIGYPVANTQMYILDTRMQPVPAGVAGELWIAGIQVGRGYVGRDDLTAQRFLPDPFSDRPGARMYRTGDLARHLPDGAIEYLGRTDFQVKIRGQRIELGEIEAALDRHPKVSQSVVMAREDTPGDLRLAAYVVPRDGTPTAAELREHLSQTLPPYMVPAAFVVLDALPLTPSGKADRRALPAPGPVEAGEGYVAPRTPAEAEIARVWGEVLSIGQVGVNDNFFELGGHSLLAVRVVERLRRSGIKLDVRSLFATPTVAALAASVGEASLQVEVPPNLIPDGCTRITPEMLPLVRLTQDEIDAIAARVPGGMANIQDIYPLAPLQEGFLFHHRMTTEGDLYVMQTLFAFESRAALDRYLEALRFVVARNDVMRTVFLWQGLDQPVQVVCRKAELSIEEVTLDPADGDLPHQLLKRYNLLNYRFDLGLPPMIRIFLCHDAQKDRWLYYQLTHHLMDDQATVNIQESELEAYLHGAADLLPRPSRFRNYVAQARLGLNNAEHTAFYREMLADVDEPTAPFGFSEVLGNGSRIDEVRQYLSSDLVGRIFAAAQKAGVSTASLFHEAFALMIGRLSGREDVVFGTVLLGRICLLYTS
ncbi:MAG: amino acid adenylation domain-containing protein, partial [Rhodobacteraceae bacterium]|nr:amino acid adenylation domain-containing protein [Paracoccaceae bacterium]